MSIGGALELIQSFNNPEIIDAPDSSLQEGKLHSRWKLLTVLRDFIQLPKLLIGFVPKHREGCLTVGNIVPVTVCLGTDDKNYIWFDEWLTVDIVALAH